MPFFLPFFAINVRPILPTSVPRLTAIHLYQEAEQGSGRLTKDEKVSRKIGNKKN
jgi:hypothetical protein